MMKRVIIATILLPFLLVNPASAKGDVGLNEAWDRANTEYVNANYIEAIEIYDSIVASGEVDAKLYYNLANAHFKESRFAEAILNYNRALRLAPSDRDIKHNLRVANTYIVDKIEELPEFFLVTWTKSWRESMSSNTLALLSLVMGAITLGAILFYLLSRKVLLRKLGLYVGMVAMVLTVTMICFSVSQKKELLEPSGAIVMKKAIAVKSSPDSGSKDIFVLHEGTKVKIVGKFNNWKEIVIADGNKGWIEESAIEAI